LAASCQDESERYFLADSRKIKPNSMLMHPRTKRKKPETRVKSSTWWDSICVAMRPWNMPKGPRPNLLPKTGKNLSKSGMGQPISDTVTCCLENVGSEKKAENVQNSMIVWTIIKRLATTAQKGPAG